MNEKILSYVEILKEQGIIYLPKVLLAIAFLIVGFWMANSVSKMVRKQMNKTGLDKDIQPFLASLVSVGIKIMVVISVAGLIGIKTTSFIAVLGAATLAVGMALQGSLGQFGQWCNDFNLSSLTE
jgi:small conductance mechanosensitive channel